ncbi:unnamed protein product, partial [Nesidiocoris tenuis]
SDSSRIGTQASRRSVSADRRSADDFTLPNDEIGQIGNSKICRSQSIRSDMGSSGCNTKTARVRFSDQGPDNEFSQRSSRSPSAERFSNFELNCFQSRIVSFNQEADSRNGDALPLFGHFCCRLAAQPECMTKDVVSSSLVNGYASLQSFKLCLWRDRQHWLQGLLPVAQANVDRTRTTKTSNTRGLRSTTSSASPHRRVSAPARRRRADRRRFASGRSARARPCLPRRRRGPATGRSLGPITTNRIKIN